MKTESVRIETEAEVKAYLSNLRYALDHGADVQFMTGRMSEKYKDEKYTNAFTVADLFPDELPSTALRRELKSLTVEEYIRTLRDEKFPNKSELREFGRMYAGKGDVYIKIRVELLSETGKPLTFIMSFHYAEFPFSKGQFPYQK